MQVKHFEGGKGFVIHKVSLPNSRLTFSVWCDSVGRILDVEAFTSTGKTYGAFNLERAKGDVGQALKSLCFRIAQAKA